MSRTTSYKLGYIVAIGLILAFAIFVHEVSSNIAGLVVLALALLVPGRVQGIFYRELFVGRRLLDHERPQDALPHFERFLGQLAATPWRRKLLWLSWSVYTPNVEAMTFNNIGAARMKLGQIEDAEASLGAALRHDPLYAIPYFNLAVLSELRGAHSEAKRLADEAKRLGYSGGSIDAVINASQTLLARIEGRQPALK